MKTEEESFFDRAYVTASCLFSFVYAFRIIFLHMPLAYGSWLLSLCASMMQLRVSSLCLIIVAGHYGRFMPSFFSLSFLFVVLCMRQSPLLFSSDFWKAVDNAYPSCLCIGWP